MIGFGGPSRADEIRPFLLNVTRGRNIPSERIDEVAHHYETMGGHSPYNELTMRQAKALQESLRSKGPALPVYVGMRNWHPYLKDTLLQMANAGHKKAIGFVLAAHRT